MSEDGKPKLTPTFHDLQAGFPGAPLPQMVQQGVPFTPLPAQAAPPVFPVTRPRREKVAIIGTAPSSRMLAPFSDQAWDIWGCSPGNMNLLPRVDAWFEIHGNLLWPEYADQYGKNYIDWLSKQPFPVYLQDESWHKKYFPHAIKFPMRGLVKRFGQYFFTSSFAWMMAFAIDKGYKEIGLYGVDMASKDEYIQQRQAFFYWLEKARELGITVTIPPESDLMQPPGLYGFSDCTRYGRKKHARKAELQGRVAQLEQAEKIRLMNELRRCEDNTNYLKGAIEDIEYDTSIWIAIGDEMEEIKLEDALETVRAAGYFVTKPEQDHGTFVVNLPVQPHPQILPFGPVAAQSAPEPQPAPVLAQPEPVKHKRKSNGQRRADHG